MIGLFDLFGYVILFIPMFFMHELGHVKACGIKADGNIHVNKFELYVDTTCNNNLSWYGGGVLSSIYMFIAAFMPINPFTFAFLTLGWTNLIYGTIEGYYHGIGKKRYLIYLINLILWGVLL